MDAKEWLTLKICTSWTFEEVLSLLVSDNDLSKIQMVSLVREEDYELCGGDYAKLAPIYQALKRAVEDGAIIGAGNGCDSLRMTTFPQGYIDNWSPDVHAEALSLFGTTLQKPLPNIFWERVNRKSFLLWYQENKSALAELLNKAGRKILFENQLNDLIPRENSEGMKNVASESKEKNVGGRPEVDPEGKIAAKIKKLKLSGAKDKDIPWDLGFTKLVQKERANNIDAEYRNSKIPPRIKGPEYTRVVGISLATAKKMISDFKK